MRQSLFLYIASKIGLIWGSSNLENTGTWKGLEEDIFIAETSMQASRFGENDLSVYADFSLNEDTQGGGTTAMNMINESQSKSIALGGSIPADNAGIGGGKSKSIDGDSYITQTMGDFNGDGYLDYVRLNIGYGFLEESDW